MFFINVMACQAAEICYVSQELAPVCSGMVLLWTVDVSGAEGWEVNST